MSQNFYNIGKKKVFIEGAFLSTIYFVDLNIISSRKNIKIISFEYKWPLINKNWLNFFFNIEFIISK